MLYHQKKGGIVLEWHGDDAKDRGALGSWALATSAIFYEPQFNSREVQGERSGAGALREGETAIDGTDIARETQLKDT